MSTGAVIPVLVSELATSLAAWKTHESPKNVTIDKTRLKYLEDESVFIIVYFLSPPPTKKGGVGWGYVFSVCPFFCSRGEGGGVPQLGYSAQGVQEGCSKAKHFGGQFLTNAYPPPSRHLSFIGPMVARVMQLIFELLSCLFIFYSFICCIITLLALSTSPHGSLLLKSIPVNGVIVGGSKMFASIIKYSTFKGLLYNVTNKKQL